MIDTRMKLNGKGLTTSFQEWKCSKYIHQKIISTYFIFSGSVMVALKQNQWKNIGWQYEFDRSFLKLIINKIVFSKTKHSIKNNQNHCFGPMVGQKRDKNVERDSKRWNYSANHA